MKGMDESRAYIAAQRLTEALLLAHANKRCHETRQYELDRARSLLAELNAMHIMAAPQMEAAE